MKPLVHQKDSTGTILDARSDRGFDDGNAKQRIEYRDWLYFENIILRGRRSATAKRQERTG